MHKNIYEALGGHFVSPMATFKEKLSQIKGFISDWDGVFNAGIKEANAPSPFAEADSMGTNLLRFAYWLREGNLPSFAIITGANNPSALQLAEREHFDAVYMKVLDKAEALRHFCQSQGIKPEETACFFDDVNDLGMAKLCGLRFFIPRRAGAIFNQYVRQNALCDYQTGSSGGENAMRECCEVMLNLQEQFAQVVNERSNFSENYQTYFSQRQSLNTKQYRYENGVLS